MPFLYIFDPRPDEEYRLLGLEGVDGSLQDRQYKYLSGLGGSGSLNDLLAVGASLGTTSLTFDGVQLTFDSVNLTFEV